MPEEEAADRLVGTQDYGQTRWQRCWEEADGPTDSRLPGDRDRHLRDSNTARPWTQSVQEIPYYRRALDDSRTPINNPTKYEPNQIVRS